MLRSSGNWQDNHPVLIVEDENGVRDLMARWLQASGYAVTAAASAEEALEKMDNVAPAVALCDIRMPGRDGLWLADQLRRRYPETAVIMATGVQDVGSAVTSLRHGVIDYLMKPFGRDRLREAVQRGLEWHRAALDARRWRETLQAEAHGRRVQLGEALAALRIDSPEALDGMLAMLTIRDRSAYAHAYRVSGLSARIARGMGLDDDAVPTIERGALLHDVGKLAMPDAVLRKPAPLTNDEQQIIRTHPQLGYDLLKDLPYLREAAEIVYCTHECYGGSGYPRGLRGDDIPLGSRIVAVADTYDTMTHPRVFRDAVSSSEAVMEVSRCAGTQFDPRVVDAFCRILAVH